jgi:hypothetical protein
LASRHVRDLVDVFPGLLAPFVRERLDGGDNALILFRRLYLNFVFALLLVGVVVIVVSSTSTLARHPI